MCLTIPSHAHPFRIAFDHEQSAEATELRHMLILAVGLTVPVMVLHVTGDLR